VAQRVPGS